VNGADVFLPTAAPAFIEVVFNRARLQVPNWASGRDGMSLVLLD
jgi:hypothetical protein